MNRTLLIPHCFTLRLLKHQSLSKTSIFFNGDKSSLRAISPLDGRYEKQTHTLKDYFSEAALMKYRVKVEVEWLKFLANKGLVHDSKGQIMTFNPKQIEFLTNIYSKFQSSHVDRIKNIESVTNHDVKAVEYFIKEEIRAQPDPSLQQINEYVHFCCTSEDINNLAYSLLLSDGKDKVLLPLQKSLLDKIFDIADKSAAESMLSRTHGQPASPTTLGKEVANFGYRLSAQFHRMESHKFSGKINGAVGNYNAHYFVYPEYNWLELSQEFIEGGLKLKFNQYTTQIEPHDTVAEFYSALNIFNTILVGLCQDFWHYISLNYFIQLVKEKEVGSSTMPHKVNPIDFENAEGNLGMSNSVAEFLGKKLLISRYQRDLSDSTVMRNHGVVFGHSALAYSSLLKGLNKIVVNKKKLNEELDQHWEVLAEPLQMMLRKLNVEGAYEKLKEMTRGKSVTKEDIRKFVEGLNIDENEKVRLRSLTPDNYVGIAESLAKQAKTKAKLPK